MYKVSVPIMFASVTEETAPAFLENFRQCKVDRVFLCPEESMYDANHIIYREPERMGKTIRYFKEHGLEVGVWVGGFGHGEALLHEQKAAKANPFVEMEGVYGDKSGYAYCPLDANFATAYTDIIQRIAALHPDLIMLDDDYRLNPRPYYMGCFCPLHLQVYRKRIGESVPREKLESLIFTGGKNKYRTAYMQLSADTLLDFAKMLRKAIDEVNPTVRLGTAVCFDTWDFAGTDAMELARAFAGNTQPYFRTIGAPYWNNNIIDVVENTRLEAAWSKGSGIEVFTEGDVYPRPRYHVPARVLELFDLLLIADGSTDGILKYMYDYVQEPMYETGYTERHIHNEGLREQVRELFSGKVPVGVHSFNVLHKVENWVLPETCEEKVADKLLNAYRSATRGILSKNSIPTAYADSGYPVFVCGENARYVTKDALKNGALLDASAAQILMEAGIDTGLLSQEGCSFASEYFTAAHAGIHNIDNKALKKLRCSEKVEVLSVFLPEGTPAAYRYENGEGMRFFVLACDIYSAAEQKNYTNSYYRQAQLLEAAQWVGRKKLPAVCEKNPNLYVLASAGEGALSVALANIFLDEILNPVVQLDKAYRQIRFVNCTGRLDGDTVYLSEIGPYGFAAFEVR